MSGPQYRVAPSSIARAWRKVLIANSVTASFPTLNPDFVQTNQGPPRITPAAGQAIVDFGSGIVASEIHLVPFGTSAADQTLKVRVWGFRGAKGGYIGTVLWAGTCTLCATTGTAGFDVTDTDYYCDAITTTIGTESVDCRTISPGSDIPATVSILTQGCELLVVEFDRNSSAASCNALLAEE